MMAMGVIRYFPRRVDVLASLHDAATVAVEAAHLLGDLFADPETACDIGQQLRDLERRGDVFTHEVVIGLNRGERTSVRQADIRAIESALADVIESMAEIGQRAALYRLPATEPARRLADILRAQTEIVAAAVPHLPDEVQHDNLRRSVMELHWLANEADHELIHALGSLYDGITEIPPFVQARRWEELYVLLEEATNRAEKIGHAMLRIMVQQF